MAKKAGKKSGRKQIGEHIEDLLVPLNGEELLARGARLAHIEQELTEHYLHEDEVKKSLKATETRLEAERMTLSGIVRSKREPRPIKVEHWADYDTGIREEIRVDTGEVLDGRARPLSPSERQETLLDPKEGAMLSPEAAAKAAEALVEKKQQKRSAKTAAKDKAGEK